MSETGEGKFSVSGNAQVKCPKQEEKESFQFLVLCPQPCLLTVAIDTAFVQLFKLRLIDGFVV